MHARHMTIDAAPKLSWRILVKVDCSNGAFIRSFLEARDLQTFTKENSDLERRGPSLVRVRSGPATSLVVDGASTMTILDMRVDIDWGESPSCVAWRAKRALLVAVS